MSRDWLEWLRRFLPRRIEHVIEDADASVHDIIQHHNWAHWHPISTAPYNRELELRIIENGKVVAIEFPCLRSNTEAWINVDLGTEIKLRPVEWRVWQRQEPPEPHHSKVNPRDRSALLHHDDRILKLKRTSEMDSD